MVALRYFWDNLAFCRIVRQCECGCIGLDLIVLCRIVCESECVSTLQYRLEFVLVTPGEQFTLKIPSIDFSVISLASKHLRWRSWLSLLNITIGMHVSIRSPIVNFLQSLATSLFIHPRQSFESNPHLIQYIGGHIYKYYFWLSIY